MTFPFTLTDFLSIVSVGTMLLIAAVAMSYLTRPLTRANPAVFEALELQPAESESIMIAQPSFAEAREAVAA